MRNLLYVNASPRGERSESQAIAAEFLAAYKTHQPAPAVDLLDLWTEPLPVYAGAGVAAKMSVFAGEEPIGDEGRAWEAVKRVFERFNAADDYLFTVPMWNHSVPWVLKHFIDTISQPGMMFGFDTDTGYAGLLENKRAVVVYTSAVYYDGAAVSFGVDFHRAYFNDWLRWGGIAEVAEIRFQPDLVTPDAEPGRAAARAEARRLGAAFASIETVMA